MLSGYLYLLLFICWGLLVSLMEKNYKVHLHTSTYIAGYIISLVLSIEAYLIVKHGLLSRRLLIGSVTVLAVSQLITQLIAFLHLGGARKSKWSLTIFAFMLTILITLVAGSLWIMYNLNYHMTSHSTDTYIIHDEGISQ
jgi:cytochrome o ubiquinol oxidase subunit IV